MGAFFTQRDFAPQNPQGKKPGYPLQFLKKPSAFLRDFRFYPLRAHGPGCRGSPASLLPSFISP
jgi:hypothetical protein